MRMCVCVCLICFLEARTRGLCANYPQLAMPSPPCSGNSRKELHTPVLQRKNFTHTHTKYMHNPSSLGPHPLQKPAAPLQHLSLAGDAALSAPMQWTVQAPCCPRSPPVHISKLHAPVLHAHVSRAQKALPPPQRGEPQPKRPPAFDFSAMLAKVSTDNSLQVVASCQPYC